MAGTLTVQNIQGPTSGDNANKIIVPAGHDLAAAGHVVQMVHAEFDGVSTSTATSSFTDTGISISITPKYATSKILVAVSQGVGINKSTTNNTARMDFRCIESNSSTTIFRYDYIGASGLSVSTVSHIISASGVFQCSDTSQLTFKTQAVRANGTSTEAADLQLNWYLESKQQIYAMEIAQ